MRIINIACCSIWHDMYRTILKKKKVDYLIAINIHL